MVEKKVKSKIDLWISVLLWGSCIFIVIIGFTLPSNEIWSYYLIIAPMLGLIVWILLGSYYELKEDLIYIRIGPFFWRIKYENIKSIKLTKNMLSSMALSIYRIEITEHNKGYFRGTTMISPVNREQFLKELKSRCYNLKK